jgi:hypothetical protein
MAIDEAGGQSMALVATRRDLRSRFILNHLSAIGHMGSPENWTCDYKRLNQPPRALPRYLASRRRYGMIEVQPVAIPQGPDLDPNGNLLLITYFINKILAIREKE